VEAVKNALSGLPQDAVLLRYLIAAPGEITTSDIDLAAASGGMVLGFNVAVSDAVQVRAAVAGMDTLLLACLGCWGVFSWKQQQRLVVVVAHLYVEAAGTTHPSDNSTGGRPVLLCWRGNLSGCPFVALHCVELHIVTPPCFCFVASAHVPRHAAVSLLSAGQREACGCGAALLLHHLRAD
jgi:hypothetical protein